MEVSSYPGYLPDSSSSEDVCPICIDKLEENVKKLVCNHCFHEKCINSWVDFNNKCPLCRRPIINENINLNNITIVENEEIVINMGNVEHNVDSIYYNDFKCDKETWRICFRCLFIPFIIVNILLSMVLMVTREEIVKYVGNFTVNVTMNVTANNNEHYTKNKYDIDSEFHIIAVMTISYLIIIIAGVRDLIIRNSSHLISSSTLLFVISMIIYSIVKINITLYKIKKDEYVSKEFSNTINHFIVLQAIILSSLVSQLLLNIIGCLCKI